MDDDDDECSRTSTRGRQNISDVVVAAGRSPIQRHERAAIFVEPVRFLRNNVRYLRVGERILRETITDLYFDILAFGNPLRLVFCIR